MTVLVQDMQVLLGKAFSVTSWIRLLTQLSPVSQFNMALASAASPGAYSKNIRSFRYCTTGACCIKRF